MPQQRWYGSFWLNGETDGDNCGAEPAIYPEFMSERLDTPCSNSNPKPTLNESWCASTEVAAGDRLPYRRTVNSRPTAAGETMVCIARKRSLKGAGIGGLAAAEFLLEACN
jgi:hypothetical protein